MRILGLTILILGGIIIGSLRGQDDVPCTASAVAWIAPEAVEAKVEGKLIFYRIRMNKAKGDWHLVNDEDKRFLDETARRIASGQYQDTKIEYTSVGGKLPQ